MVVVLVTGVSGFIAGPLAKSLVSKGYHVRGTVRSLANPEKVDHLQKELPEVELFEADLLDEGSFDTAATGCEIVFHTAIPFILQEEIVDAQKQVVEPALKGTLNVLHSVEKAGTVRRVVITSSVAAIASTNLPEDHVFTEADWNETATIENGQGYRLSKVLAERAAWDFQKGKKWDLVAINPAFVLGAPLSPRTDSASVKTVKSFLDGSIEVVGNACFARVSLYDVVEAHVRAAENPKAQGRYLMASSVAYSSLDLCEMLRKSGKFDKYPIPTKESAPVTKRAKQDASKVTKELGLDLVPVEEAIVGMAQALIDLGVVKRLD